MDLDILVFVLVGFIAQMIDGALGMAYGVSSNTFLLSLGIPPAAASASVHMAEVVTTGISGFSHWKLGNVDWKLVRRLLVPGVIGGVFGAYVLTAIDGNIIKPYIACLLYTSRLRVVNKTCLLFIRCRISYLNRARTIRIDSPIFALTVGWRKHAREDIVCRAKLGLSGLKIVARPIHCP